MNRTLIAALGNPGSEYADTRHNVGFLIADRIAADAGVRFATGRHGEVTSFKYKARPVIIIKPNTYMNLSGKAVNYWLGEEGLQPSNLLVLVDELALPLGKIRLGPKGSDGGHNGLISIQEALGTTAYPRLRFGIGNTFGKGQQVDYVLGQWTTEERAVLNERIPLAAEAVKTFIFAGLETAMNRFNSR
jgi:peptidyl-tRNA hydrolase, PTH1 family